MIKNSYVHLITDLILSVRYNETEYIWTVPGRNYAKLYK